MKQLFLLLLFSPSPAFAPTQDMRQGTYCSPLNIDYTYMIYNSDKDISYRPSADPAVVRFRGECHTFVARSSGYWHSKDLLGWNFIASKNWYSQGGDTPAAHNYKDFTLYVTGDSSGPMSTLYSDDPRRGEWKATSTILHNLQDPDLFIDSDGQAYVFWESSNIYSIRGVELDKNRCFLPKGEVKELFNLDIPHHSRECLGKNHSDTVLGGYIEGPWLTKHNGRYYMQYSAPSIEFNIYTDDVYVVDHPMGPHTYQRHSPASYKPGGHVSGAEYGSTIRGPDGAYQYFTLMALSINVNWKRRLCVSPAGFDKDGIMYVDTRFGDYPHYASAVPGRRGRFQRWMFLSYRKPVTASVVEGGFGPAVLTDELTKTFWLAEANDERQQMMIDLENPTRICTVQVDYHDYRSDMYDWIPGLRHHYVIEGSTDGGTWSTLVDRKGSYKDTPNDYVELETPATVCYVRYRNINVSTPNLTIPELRIFGLGFSEAPRRPGELILDRYVDRRDVTTCWEPVKGAQGYNMFWGIASGRLYSSWMVYDSTKLLMKSLTTNQDHYFAVEVFNENGVFLPSETRYAE